MPKGVSGTLFHEMEKEKRELKNRESTFYFLEGLGTLFWVLGDVSWIFQIKYVFPAIYVLAVLGNFAALIYCFLRLRHTVPIIPVIAYNLWVIMGCFWVFAEVGESERILLFARTIGAVLVLVTIGEFTVNRNNKENLITFIKMLRKFRIREEAAGLSVADIRTFPDDLLRLFRWMTLHGEVGLAEVTSFMKQNEAMSRNMLAVLVERGYIKEIATVGNTRYRVRLAPGRRREVPLSSGEDDGESE